MALIETNLGPTGLLETGATDDFGLVVRVGQTRVGASVVPGELVFLSLSGGREGADVDTLDVPPHANQTVVIYLDLDPLDSVLGAETITRLYVVDGSGSGEVDVLDVIALPEPNSMLMLVVGLTLLALLHRRMASRSRRATPGSRGPAARRRWWRRGSLGRPGRHGGATSARTTP